MNVIARIVLLAALVVTAPLSWAQRAGLQMCSGETEKVIAAALRYGLGNVPGDFAAERIDLKSPVVPDYGILKDNGRIYVRNYLDDPNCIIDVSVLPRSANVTFTLVDEDQIRELAERDGDGVTYVRATEVRFRDGEVGIGLGVALRPAPGNARGLTCLTWHANPRIPSTRSACTRCNDHGWRCTRTAPPSKSRRIKKIFWALSNHVASFDYLALGGLSGNIDA